MGSPPQLVKKDQPVSAFGPEFVKSYQLVSQDFKLLKSFAPSDSQLRKELETKLTNTVFALTSGQEFAVESAKTLHLVVVNFKTVTDMYSRAKKQFDAMNKRGWGNNKNKEFFASVFYNFRAQYDLFEKNALSFINDANEQNAKKMDAVLSSFKTAYSDFLVVLRCAMVMEVNGARNAQALINGMNQIARVKGTVQQYAEESDKKELLRLLDVYLRTLKDEFEQLKSFRNAAYLSATFDLADGRVSVSEEKLERGQLNLFEWFNSVHARSDALMDAVYTAAWKPLFQQFLSSPSYQKDPNYTSMLLRILEKSSANADATIDFLRKYSVAKIDDNGNIIYKNGRVVSEKLGFSESALSELRKQKERLQTSFYALREAVREYHDSLVAGKRKTMDSDIATGPTISLRVEDEYGLSALGVLDRRFNLTKDMEGYYNSDFGTVFQDKFGPYMDKVSKRTWWDKNAMLVTDGTAVVLAVIPTGVTQVAAGAYFVARGSSQAAFHYSMTGKMDWDSVAIAASGFAMFGGAVLKLTKFGTTAAGVRVALGFSGVSLISGTYLAQKGVTQLTDDITKTVKYGWTSDRTTSMFSNGLLLALGAKGVRDAFKGVNKVLNGPGPTEGVPRPIESTPSRVKRVARKISTAVAKPVRVIKAVGKKLIQGPEEEPGTLTLYSGIPIRRILRAIAAAFKKAFPRKKISGLAEAESFVSSIEGAATTARSLMDKINAKIESTTDSSLKYALESFKRELQQIIDVLTMLTKEGGPVPEITGKRLPSKPFWVFGTKVVAKYIKQITAALSNLTREFKDLELKMRTADPDTWNKPADVEGFSNLIGKITGEATTTVNEFTDNVLGKIPGWPRKYFDRNLRWQLLGTVPLFILTMYVAIPAGVDTIQWVRGVPPVKWIPVIGKKPEEKNPDRPAIGVNPTSGQPVPQGKPIPAVGVPEGAAPTTVNPVEIMIKDKVRRFNSGMDILGRRYPTLDPIKSKITDFFAVQLNTNLPEKDIDAIGNNIASAINNYMKTPGAEVNQLLQKLEAQKSKGFLQPFSL